MIRPLVMWLLLRRLRRENPELFDGHQALAAVLDAIRDTPLA